VSKIWQRTTRGFVQVWLDGKAISSKSILKICSSLTERYLATTTTINKSKEIGLDVMGGRNSIPTPAQSLVRWLL